MGQDEPPGVRVIRVVEPDPRWPVRFGELGRRLRQALGDVAVRIDHIGSTAVPGLAAKPVVDIQISVARLEPVEPFRVPQVGLGYVYRAGNPERTKRYFREPPGEPRTHIHVRRAGSFSEQFPLLFRDYLREHREAAEHYAAVKRRLAARHPHDGRALLADHPAGGRVGADDRMVSRAERRLRPPDGGAGISPQLPAPEQKAKPSLLHGWFGG
ncbi:GrpB family protein [Actinoplanes sp. NPDC049599]|uniref:GrpB family protein n=1 Tax=Actinoplanes sp. NPDC049599 TaxID=3363903 RepID=UPI00379432BC